MLKEYSFLFTIKPTLLGFNLFLSICGIERIILSVRKNCGSWDIDIENLDDYGIGMIHFSWSNHCEVRGDDTDQFKRIITDTMNLVNTNFDEKAWKSRSVSRLVKKICDQHHISVEGLKDL